MVVLELFSEFAEFGQSARFTFREEGEGGVVCWIDARWEDGLP